MSREIGHRPSIIMGNIKECNRGSDKTKPPVASDRGFVDL